MSKKIAINGFGRIGRLTARIIIDKFEDSRIIAVNDLTSPENLAYLLKYDSTYRQANFEVKAENDFLIITKNGKEQQIKVLSEKEPANLPWKQLEIDTVIESTGFFIKSELAEKHLQAGAKKVIISAPAKGEGVETVVLGVNRPNPASTLISNASCTTNCIAPAFKILHDNFGVKQAFGITAHAYTASQTLQDGPSKKDFRDGRAAAVNAIPSSTGAAKAVFEVIPQLKGKISLSSLRIPVITGSMVYITVELEKTVSAEEINSVFRSVADKDMKNLVEYSDGNLVSSDIIQNPHSCIFDAKLTEVLGQTAKIVVWYDNEWGYSNRLAELVQIVS